MKAISVRAPWWWAILHGKPVENRDWPTNIRGTIALHASKWWKIDEVDDDLETIAGMFEKDCLTMPWPDIQYMRRAGGCIVGTVEIVDCVRSHHSAFFVGRYGFVLKNATRLEKPVPIRGSLGFFEVREEAERLRGAEMANG